MLVSAGDRHCEAGTKPVRQGGGWLIASPRSMRASPGNASVVVWATEPTCGKQHQHLLDALAVAQQQAGDDFEVRQRLRQRFAHTTEHVVGGVQGRGGVGQHALAAADPAAAVWVAMMLRLWIHCLISSAEAAWLLSSGRRLGDDVVDVGGVALRIRRQRLCRVDQSVQRRAQTADRRRRLVEHRGDLVLRQRRQAAIDRLQRRADVFGHGARVMVLPGVEVLASTHRRTPDPGTARRPPTPSARWPSRPAGSCSRSSMLIVTWTPDFVGSTAVTLPIVAPR